MAAATDKARFYIEQTVPDLRDWERRQLFTKPEISSITSQRTGYETQLNSREASSALYIRYLTYESNVSLLLSKRLSRHAVLPKSAQKLRTSQQRRMFKILDRATTKFKEDLNLWAQYLHFCREQAAIKRGQKVLTQCLRLFPARPEVWGYAAGWAEGSGDLSAARGYYLRGLRFCGNAKSGKDLYLRFARAEMRWVGERRKIVGLGDEDMTQPPAVKMNSGRQISDTRDEEVDAGAIARTCSTEAPTDAEDDPGALATEDPNAFHHFSATPAMTGAIPIAIFGQAMTAHQHSQDLAEAFFDMFCQFSDLPCTPRTLKHVVKTMEESSTSPSVSCVSCKARLPLVGTAVDSPTFPQAVRDALAILKQSARELEDRGELAGKVQTWMQPLLDDDRLVSELRTVLKSALRQLPQPQASLKAALK